MAQSFESKDHGSPPEMPLSPQEPMILLAYRCLTKNLADLVAHRPTDGLPLKPDDIHQMRIATRRLRVGLRLFGHMLPPSAAHRLRRELRWLAHALGQVRDLDVQIGELRLYMREPPPDEAGDLDAYELALRRNRQSERTELTALLDGQRYGAIVETLHGLLEGGVAAAALRRWQSFKIVDGAKNHLKKARKRVLKLGKRLQSDASADELHCLRIRAKRLRYELEFFEAVYPELGSAIKAVKMLQDVLGEHQDADTAVRRLGAYARQQRRLGHFRATPPALAAWRTAQKQRSTAARESFPAEWRRFVAALKSSPKPA